MVKAYMLSYTVQLDLSLSKHYSIDNNENHKLLKLKNLYFIKMKRSLMVFRERRGFYVFPSLVA